MIIPQKSSHKINQTRLICEDYRRTDDIDLATINGSGRTKRTWKAIKNQLAMAAVNHQFWGIKIPKKYRSGNQHNILGHINRGSQPKKSQSDSLELRDSVPPPTSAPRQFGITPGRFIQLQLLRVAAITNLYICSEVIH